MVSFDVVRDALLSPQPWTGMDQVVRNELAAGRLTHQIKDELLAMEKALREIPGFSEQSEEAFLDTLDLLIGFCPAGREYQNPPVLPSEEEIAKLPRWARVAFAARCARRVLNIYSHFRLNPIIPTHSAVNPIKAVEIAETSAELGQSLENSNSGYSIAHSSVRIDEDPNDAAAHSSTNSAAYAAADAGDNLRPIRAFYAMQNSHYAARPFLDISFWIRRDYDHLARLALWLQWRDDTPVSTVVFGPLWTEGSPNGWPLDLDTPRYSEFNLEVAKSENMSEQEYLDEIMNLFNAVNYYHISRGGHPLTLSDLQPFVPALVPVEV